MRQAFLSSLSNSLGLTTIATRIVPAVEPLGFPRSANVGVPAGAPLPLEAVEFESTVYLQTAGAGAYCFSAELLLSCLQGFDGLNV